MARQAIEETNARFMAAFNRGDAAGVAALYTEDAVLMPPGSETIRGKQGVEQFWSGAIRMGIHDATLRTVEVEESGDTAYEIGAFSLRIRAGEGQTLQDAGKYVVIWRREAGVWKLAVDIWNSNASAPGA